MKRFYLGIGNTITNSSGIVVLPLSGKHKFKWDGYSVVVIVLL